MTQIKGTLGNVRSGLADIELVDVLPPSVVSTLIWARDTIPRGLGFADRTGHVTGVIALTIVMIVASATLLTVVAVGYFIVAMPIALLRYIPSIEQRWPWTTTDWPFWSVKSEGFGA